MKQTYDEHLETRRQQKYQSTRLWNVDPHSMGMAGERALGHGFEYEPEYINMPGGDGGVDREVLLLLEQGESWTPLDVKATPYGDWLRVETPKPGVVYINAHYFTAIDQCVLTGWAWGKTLLATPKVRWTHNYVHAIHVKHLQRMRELYLSYTGLSRHPLLKEARGERLGVDVQLRPLTADDKSKKP